MEIFFGWIILSFVAGAIGSNRKIGFASAFFLSLFLSPLVGIICALASKANSQIAFEKNMLDQAKQQTDQLAKANKGSFTDELFKLKTLLDSGLITIEEFENEKEKLKSNIDVQKTILALYCSQTPSISGKLQVKVEKGDYFVDLPVNKENAIKYEVPPGQIEVVINPTGLAFKKTVFLEVKEGTTAYYDIFKIY